MANVLLQEIKDGANPQVANLHKKRFVLVQEPNGKKRICASTLKEITGDSTLNARKNYSNDCGCELLLTLLLECNDLPAIDEVNDAIQRRIRTIPFVSSFVSQETYDAKEDKTNVYVGNPYYKEKEFQTNYKQALIQLLLPHWEQFQNDKHQILTTPRVCKQKATDYLALSDNVYEWFSERYERGDLGIDYVIVSDVYNEFTRSELWNNLSKNDRRNYNKTNFKTKIETNLFIRDFYKERDSYFNQEKIRQPYLVGWRLIDTHTKYNIIQ